MASAADPSQARPHLDPQGPVHDLEPGADFDPDAHVGEVIANRFRLVARIHTSSTGAVYRAEDLSLARTVALRLLTPILSRDAALLDRLQHRLQASTQLARDEVRVLSDIVDLIDLGRSDGGQVFVVTDFIAGENLAEQLTREGPLPWTAVRPLMVRACQILHLSHEHGALRLDLQTRHLFPVRDKTAASTLKILSPGLHLDPALSPEMIRYAAPEQITRAACDRRTDVYALGVIMYELLTGRVPFADAVPAVILARHLLEPPPPLPAHLLEHVPSAALAIVHRALAKQPAERWPTMKAMANAMAAIDFGPCDVSGMLEVVDGEPPLPSTSSASMHIDPSASHGAASPAVRPRTFPPLQHAFTDQPPSEPEPRPADSSLSLSSAALVSPAQPPPSQRPSPAASRARSSESSSLLAWAEILAAADEAITLVAAAAHDGDTSGDSGVFQPERMLHTGEAASASQMRGRRPVVQPEPSLAETLVMPVSLLRRDAPGDSRSEPTLQLGPEDLLALSSTSLSSARLPPPDDAITASYPAVPPATPSLPAAVTAALSPPSGNSATAAMSTDDPHPHPEESASTLRFTSPAERSTAWQTPAPPAPRRSSRLAWAAGLLLLVAAGVAVARLGASDDLSDRTAANTPRPARSAAPREAAPAVPNLSPGTGPADLSPGTAANPPIALAATPDPPAGPAATPPPGAAVTRAPSPTTGDPSPAAAATRDLSSGTAADAPPGLPAKPAAVAPVRDLSPETAADAPRDPAAIPASDPPPAANLSPKPASDRPRPARPAAAKPAPPSPEPAAPQRKSAPGAHRPNAGDDPFAANDPQQAADLLRSAEQSAARGEHGHALGLATQSFHAAPSARALQVVGEAACKLGNVGKAKWARQHLAPADRPPVETACAGAGVALD